MYIDLLIKIKNAQAVGKSSLKARFTRMDKMVADILQRHGFINKVEVKGRPSKRFMYIELKANRSIEKVKMLSKPSLLQYTGYKDIRRVKSGYGLLVLSTPKGVMTGKDAKRDKIGGQMLFTIW